MSVIFIVALSLLLISSGMRRLRSAEVLLVTPFAAGAVILPITGAVPFLEVREGHLVLAAFLAFEWALLTAMGAMHDAMRLRHSPRINLSRLARYGPGLRAVSLLICALLVGYTVSVATEIGSAASLASYFLERRAQAHAGEGVDTSNPLAYRAINFSMAVVLLTFSWRHFMSRSGRAPGRFLFLLLIITGGVASILEGNRSTLIVTVIAMLCFAYEKRLIRARAMTISLAAFVLVFVASMQLLRLEGDFSVDGIRLAFSWFGLYAFGSVASFADFFQQDIQTFWYTFDIAAQKFGETFAGALGAREFFIIDYVDIGSMSTNVYTGYAVLYDYLGLWAVLFLVIKNAFFQVVRWAGHRGFVASACYIALLGSYPLTIYHEFMLTALYYCLNVLEIAVVLWLLTRLGALVHGNPLGRPTLRLERGRA